MLIIILHACKMGFRGTVFSIFVRYDAFENAIGIDAKKTLKRDMQQTSISA